MASSKTSTVNYRERANAMFSGSDFSEAQWRLLEAYVKKHMKRGILVHLGCSESQLQRFANSKLPMSDLPDKTRERIASSVFEPVYANGKSGKAWPRKTSAGLYQLQQQRKRNRPAKAKPKAETPEA
jgi:hypothetical protein